MSDVNALGREDALDVELFARQHAKGVSLTSAGRALLPEARFLVDRARDFQTRAQAYSSVLAGTLKIGCYSPLAAVFLPSIIAECSARFSKVSLSFVEGPVEELIQKLESGELDLALMYETGLPNGLIWVFFWHAPWILLKYRQAGRWFHTKSRNARRGPGNVD